MDKALLGVWVRFKENQALEQRMLETALGIRIYEQVVAQPPSEEEMLAKVLGRRVKRGFVR